jgi:hypothetical protein
LGFVEPLDPLTEYEFGLDPFPGERAFAAVTPASQVHIDVVLGASLRFTHKNPVIGEVHASESLFAGAFRNISLLNKCFKTEGFHTIEVFPILHDVPSPQSENLCR